MGAKIDVDIEEMEEMIDLYIELKCGGLVSKLSKNGMVKFNKEIANNPNYVRKNGKLFNLYKYNKWAGSYNGVDSEGKVLIENKLKKNEVKVVGQKFVAETKDIIQLVNDFHKKPEQLTKKLCRLFERERSLNASAKKIEDDLRAKIDKLQRKIELTDKALTNLMYQTQSPGNALNNMLKLSKSEDEICIDELKDIFNSNQTYIEKLVEGVKNANKDNDSPNNIISLPSKTRKRDKAKYSRLSSKKPMEPSETP